jgi:hypothetical protein
MIMAGPAVDRRGSVGVIKMTQIAPTQAISTSALRRMPAGRWTCALRDRVRLGDSIVGLCENRLKGTDNTWPTLLAASSGTS